MASYYDSFDDRDDLDFQKAGGAPLSSLKRKTAKTAKKEKAFKINRYYVSHPKISDAIAAGKNDSWTRPSLAKAIEHAQEQLKSGVHEVVAIVQIVRLVRRVAPPVAVEKL